MLACLSVRKALRERSSKSPGPRPTIVSVVIIVPQTVQHPSHLISHLAIGEGAYQIKKLSGKISIFFTISRFKPTIMEFISNILQQKVYHGLPAYMAY